MNSRRTFNRMLLAGAGLALAPAGIRPAFAAGGDLNLAPIRVVLAPSARAATVFVFNRGQAASTYAVELVDRLMTAEGSIRSVADVESEQDVQLQRDRLRSARSLISYSPRRVSLAPGESQTIRLRVQRPSDLPEGEYRSHLTITQLPPDESGMTPSRATAPAPDGIAVSLRALFSASIPVIVRAGAVASAGQIGTISQVHVAASGKMAAHEAIAAEILRTGNGSLYGDVTVKAVGGGRDASPLGAIRGIGVYPEIDRRTIKVPLSRTLAKGETVDVVFTDQDVRPGQVIAVARYTAT